MDVATFHKTPRNLALIERAQYYPGYDPSRLYGHAPVSREDLFSTWLKQHFRGRADGGPISGAFIAVSRGWSIPVQPGGIIAGVMLSSFHKARILGVL
ncbi:hypothetical protein E4U14_000105 [Claviceps sp. LM454 group G7]|nr:hypothetical protein E4U14_000105 [Claviceps sp. LM454 group G7]